MTKNKDTAGYNYLTVEYTKGNGKMVFSMELANIGIKVVNGKKEFGQMGKMSNDL